jgi:hypothetical protein
MSKAKWNSKIAEKADRWVRGKPLCPVKGGGVLPTNYTVFKEIVLSGSGSLDLNLPVQIQRRFGTFCA